MKYRLYLFVVRMVWGGILFLFAFLIQSPQSRTYGRYRSFSWPADDDLPRVLIVSVIAGIVGFGLGPLLHRWRNDRLEDD